LEERSRDLTAMQTPFGLLRMAVVPQGGTNSVAHVVNAANMIFAEFIPHILQPFIDDIPMKGVPAGQEDQTEVAPGVRAFVRDHIADVEKVLVRAEEVGLTFSGAKSRFGVREIPLLGFLCGPYGRRVEGKKVMSIRDIHPCRSVREVRRFLGATGVYRAFIPHYGELAEPLYALLRKKTPWQWTSTCGIDGGVEGRVGTGGHAEGARLWTGSRADLSYGRCWTERGRLGAFSGRR
jgi:hypothetical protein